MISKTRAAAEQEHDTLAALRLQAMQTYMAARRSCGPHSPIHRVFHALAARAADAAPSEQMELARLAIECVAAFATLNSADATALAVDAGGPEPWRVNGHGRIAFRAAMSAHPALAAFQVWDDKQRADAGHVAVAAERTVPPMVGPARPQQPAPA